MKVALISPNRGELVGNPKLQDFFWQSKELSARAEVIYKWPELGLLTLAALMPVDFEIVYMDEGVEPIRFDENFDLVALTGLTPKATRAYEIADAFRRKGTYVIMGGPHASVLPDEALEHVDSVFIGEAQVTWNDFLLDFQKGQPKPIYDAAGRFADMTKTPIPRYDLLNVDNYKNIPIETTRGCPHDCEFCSSTRLWGHKYRKKNVDQVLAEIHTIKALDPAKYLFFVDDNMFVDRKFSYRLLAAMAPIKRLRWFTQTDISIAEDDKLLDLMYAAGCREVLIGFETLSPKNLREVNKSQWKLKKLEKYPWAIDKIQSRGISIYGSFILGLDHDDETVFDSLRDFILDTKLLGFQLLIMTPIPGTKIAQRLAEENRLIEGVPWGHFSTYQLNYKLKGMSKEVFEEGMLRLFEELYSEEAFTKRKKHYRTILKNLPGEKIA